MYKYKNGVYNLLNRVKVYVIKNNGPILVDLSQNGNFARPFKNKLI